MSSYTTYLISKMDQLKYIFQIAIPIGKLANLKMLLNDFDILYVTQEMVKGQALEDHLSKNPITEEYEPLETYFPDEDVFFI